MRGFLSFIVVLLALAGVAAYFTLFTVHQTQQAMVLQFGEPIRVISEPGLKIKIPFVQNVTYFDKRVLELDSPPQEVLVLGKKRMVVDAFARYRIIDPLRFFQTVRDVNIARNRLSAILNASLRRVLAQSSLNDVVRDKRRELTLRISKLANDEAKDLGMAVVDVRIKRADLPEKISNDIFKRMRAERQREASQYRAEGAELAKTIRAQADRESVTLKAIAARDSEIIRGDGDAIRNRVFAEAYGQDTDFFAFYRYMQAYEKGLGSKDTRLILTPNSDFFRYFNDPLGKRGGAAAQQ